MKIIEIEEIMELLPHRYPFLMVDKVEVFNIYGQQVLIQENEANRVMVDKLGDGVYLMAIYYNGKKSVKKVIIN